MLGSTSSTPRLRSEAWRCCWTGKPRTDRSRCRRMWKRLSVTSPDCRTGLNSGPRRDTIESGPAKACSIRQQVYLYSEVYRVNPDPSASWPHAFQLHVAHAIPDFAEEDLFLHPVSESDRPADFRPRAAVALWDDVHEILCMVRLRVALVGAEVRAVLEAGLRDHAAAREILVCLKAEFEIGLKRLRLLDEPRESDRTVRVRVPHFDEPGLQQVRRLEEAELQATSDDLPEETGVVERLRLDLINHDRAIPEKVDDHLGLPERGRRMTAPPRPPPVRGVPPGRRPRARSTPAPNICSASSSARRPADTPGNRRVRRGLRRRNRGPSGPGTPGSESRTRSSRRSRPGTVPGRPPPSRGVAPRAGLPRRDTPPPGDSTRGRLRVGGRRRTRDCRPRCLPPGRRRSRGRRAVPPPSGTANAGTAIKGSPAGRRESISGERVRGIYIEVHTMNDR